MSCDTEKLEAQLKAADVLHGVAKSLLDNYGFTSDGCDGFREVPVNDIIALETAMIAYNAERDK